MRRTMIASGMAFLCMTVMAVAEPQTTPPPPNGGLQLNTQFLSDLMRSAVIFNGMVQSLNLNKTLHESGVVSNSADPNANMKRTAAVLGAGAGVGLAVGGMTGSQKGAMIGAVAGSAGAYVIDQIVQRQAKAKLANADSSGGYDHDLRQLQQRPAQQQ
jgi:hypothetical protein